MINIELRHPEDVMKLSRLGSFHQSKLSFLRSFIREFKNWEFNRDIFDLDKDGYGVVVYSVRKNKRIYYLICFSQHINAQERSDRVIATKWDAAFVLHDGMPTKNDIERLKENVPKQEIGRMSNKELALSRANKSVRIFDHVVNSLSSVKQPDVNLLNKEGYFLFEPYEARPIVFPFSKIGWPINVVAASYTLVIEYSLSTWTSDNGKLLFINFFKLSLLIPILSLVQNALYKGIKLSG